MQCYLLVTPDGGMSRTVVDLLRHRSKGELLHVTVLLPSPTDSQAVAAAARSGTGTGTVTVASPSGPQAVAYRDEDRRRLEELVTEFRALNADVRGVLTSADVVTAVADAFRDDEYDQIILCQRSQPLRRLVRMDLRRRLQRRFAVPVTHVPCRAP